MNKYFGALVCLLIIFGGCKREAVPTVSRKELKNLAIKDVNFNFLTTRSKLSFDDGDRSFSATANIRIKKDSLIWFSITPGFGIEAARGIITRDSLFLMNKLEKNYYAYSFAGLSKQLQVSLSYDVLQSAILGDLIRPISLDDRIKRQEDQVIIIQEEPLIDISNFINNETLKLTKVVLQDKDARNSLTLDYADFKPNEGNVIPYSATISARQLTQQELKTTTVAFKHNKAEFSNSPLAFPFEIPDKYDRKN